jgi:hypothetical protein
MSKLPKAGFIVHFPKSLLAMLVLLIFTLGYLIITLGHYDNVDEESYHQLISSASNGNGNQSYTTTQERQGVCKDIIFSDNGKRLQMRLRSEQSEMAMHRRDEHTEIVEHMSGVKCCLQENLIFLMPDGSEVDAFVDGAQPVQVVLFLEADQASYNYKRDLFTAKTVNVIRYRAEGHVLDENAHPLKTMTSGIADSVEFSLAGQGTHFKADGFKAKFYSQSRIVGKQP